VKKYKEASSLTELVPAFYAAGWANVVDGKSLPATEGAKTIRAWFKDGNELISSSIGSATITLDKTQPSLSVSSPPATTTSQSVTLGGTTTDALAGVESLTARVVSLASPVIFFSPTEQPVTVNEDGSFSSNLALEVGSNQITLTSVDKAGNTSEQVLTVTRENTVDGSGTPTGTTTSESSSVTSGTAVSGSAASSSASNSANNSITEDTAPGSGIVEKTIDSAKELTNKIQDEYHKESKIAIVYWIIGIILALTTYLIIKRKKSK